jgi:hypothetical protein
MTYHVMLTSKLREFWPGNGSVNVEDIKNHFMSIIDQIPEKSQGFITDLNTEYALRDTFTDERIIPKIIDILKDKANMTDEDAYERFILVKRGNAQRLSSVISNTRARIVETSTSTLYAEKHTPYGIMSIKGGYWEFLPKEEYDKRQQGKDKVSVDRVTTRMLMRDPNNQLLQQIRNLTLLLK